MSCVPFNCEMSCVPFSFGRPAENGRDARAIGRVLTRVRNENLAIAINQEISAQLKDVFRSRQPADLFALEQQLDEVEEDPRSQEVHETNTAEAKVFVPLAMRIGHDREGDLLAFDKALDHIGWGVSDADNPDAGSADLLVMTGHLAEVGNARHSGKVTEEQEQSLFRIDQFGEFYRRLIGTNEGEVRDGFERFHNRDAMVWRSVCQTSRRKPHAKAK